MTESNAVMQVRVNGRLIGLVGFKEAVVNV